MRILILIIIFSILTCFPALNQTFPNNQSDFEAIETRFPPPEGFKRIQVKKKSFAAYLRNLPLLAEHSPVKDYRGHIKKSAEDTTVAAVFAYSIRGKKLEQCMDIILRFYAEYLWSQQRQEEICFYLPGAYPLKWTDWKNGFRPIYHGVKLNLTKTGSPDSSRNSFEAYLWEIFYRSNTQTAYFAYNKVKQEEVQIGDFIVKKGKKGHAVLIVDIATDSLGNKVGLIGQGDTPACQFYLLNYQKGNPWFPFASESAYPALPIKKKMYWVGLRRF